LINLYCRFILFILGIALLISGLFGYSLHFFGCFTHQIGAYLIASTLIGLVLSSGVIAYEQEYLH